jgi:hypothetical protein
MTVNSFSSSGDEIAFSYTAELKSPVLLDIVETGANGTDNTVYQLFGSKSQLEDQYPEIAAAIEIALTAGREGTANGNKLYLIFCPTVIEYKKYVTIGDLEAALGEFHGQRKADIAKSDDRNGRFAILNSLQ